MALTWQEKLKAEGFAVIENLFDAESLAEAESATAELIRGWQAGVMDDDEDFRTYEHAEAPRPVLYRIHNLEKKDPCFGRLIVSRPLAGVVRRVLGPGAVPTAVALIVKMPRYGGEVPYHRDPIDVPSRTVFNFSIFLDESGPHNGCFEAVPASHLLPGEVPTRDGKPVGLVQVAARPGDVLVHDVCLFHGSAFSRSEKMRRSVCVEFQPAHIFAGRA